MLAALSICFIRPWSFSSEASLPGWLAAEVTRVGVCVGWMGVLPPTPVMLDMALDSTKPDGGTDPERPDHDLSGAAHAVDAVVALHADSGGGEQVGRQVRTDEDEHLIDLELARTGRRREHHSGRLDLLDPRLA